MGPPDPDPPKDEQQDQGKFPDWLKEPLGAVLGALITAGGLLTFVAAVGGAIVWVRFYAAELPAGQALAALPRGELIASGAVLLAAFLALGFVAVVAVYVLDLYSPEIDGDGVFRGLLALVTVEALIVVAATVDAGAARRVLAAEVVLLIAGAALALFWLRQAVLHRWSLRRQWTWENRLLLTVVALVALFALAVVGSILGIAGHEAGGWWERWIAPLAMVLLAPLALVAIAWVGGFLRPGPLKPPPERARLVLPRRAAVAAIGLLAVLFVALPALIATEWWVAVSLGTAVGLAVGCGLVAVRGRGRPFPLLRVGAAVFMSVPVLGAVAGITRNIEEPQVQPIAFIRQDDGIAEAIQGIYVTETKDRLYFANVATDQCTDRIEPHSGRLLWVPRKEIVTMALGPPQSVEEAGTKALEMYYALAPGAVNPALAAGARAQAARARAASAEEEKGPPKRRLDDVGPALRRDFQLDPQLSRGSAEPGARLTVRRPPGARRLHEEDGAQQALRVGSALAESVESRGENHPLPWRFAEDGAQELEFEVPKAAKSGLVTIECGGFATEPYLSVRKQPIARITLRLRPGRGEAMLDGRRSKDRDSGRLVERRWKVDGQVVGIGRRVARPLPDSVGAHDLWLEVVDDQGDRDSAHIRVWRPGPIAPPRPLVFLGVTLPGAAVVPEGLAAQLRVRNARLEALVYPHGSRRGARRIARRLREVRRELRRAGLEGVYLRVRRMPRGDARCPVPHGGRRAYVELYAITPDVALRLPKGCRPLPA